MSSIKRFYTIHHPCADIVRAWQGHKSEKKWFHCVVGSFIIIVNNIDNWENPANDLKVTSYYLKANNPSVLYMPGGHVTGIKALKSDASLIVFSDMLVKESKDDDFWFDKNKWFN